eukprot:TRINITY_DN4046_c0_g1_i1.p1 TRINITY_DN4046_c0_g1~~TRINITY_DN4046_c0_g1_i1.p1  ORF type:complete len:396 (-),score=46.80 TRINITY_DN4046_c0_g1_i1:98-1285(-)
MKMKIMLMFVVLSLFAGLSNSLNNGLALTPPMGWNSWNHYLCNTSEITQEMFMSQAKAMVDSGMAKVGYEYINLDDCWLAATRDAQGILQPDPKRFPNGIKYLADYIHGLGLKFGIYEDSGNLTCGGYPGSEGYYQVDTETFASWGVDYVKLDGCYSEPKDMQDIYTQFGVALNHSGRPMVYSCSYPAYTDLYNVTIDWTYLGVICNLWREYNDIRDNWESITSILDYQVSANLRRWAGVGHWNDPDMLEVGNGGMTTTEYISHFSLWSILAAPLIAGNDLTSMDQTTLQILTNYEVIQVDQDKEGIQGNRVWKMGDLEIWSRPLSYKSLAVVLFNRSQNSTTITVDWPTLGLQSTASFEIRDLWAHKNLGTFSQKFSAQVASHGVVMVKFTPSE